MVRRSLWEHGLLRYRRGTMTATRRPPDPDSPVGDVAGPVPHHLDPVALSVAATTATGGFGSPGPEDEPGMPRPWTAAAAREPLPPLAPPPARPGAGTTVIPALPAASGAVGRALVSVTVLAVAVVVIVLLVVVLGH